MNLDALLPLIILAAGAMLTFLLAAFTRNHRWVAATGVAGLILFLASLLWVPDPALATVAPLLQVDPFALYYWALIGGATLVVALFCYSHFQAEDGAVPEQPEEIYGLLMLSALGACVLSGTSHFLGLFLGLELVSLPLFILVAYRCRFPRPIEAGIKYLILSGLATGLLLFGIALVYTHSGTLAFEGLSAGAGLPVTEGYAYAGMALIMTGLAFKLSLVPLHFWTPDVYQGAPAPITAFLATVSKTAVMAVVLRLTLGMDLTPDGPVWAALAGVAGISMLVGNWLALRQGNLKRLLAYSSVAHMGYALAAVLTMGALAVEAVSFYLAFYVTTTLGAFGVIVALSRSQRATEWEADDRESIRGLFWRRPWLSSVLMLMMLSLAGIPLTAGFFGKFYVLLAGAEAGLWRLMLLVIAGSAIGLYYYLRVILGMLERTQQVPDLSKGRQNWLNSLCLIVLSLAVIWMGVYPDPLMTLAGTLVGSAG